MSGIIAHSRHTYLILSLTHETLSSLSTIFDYTRRDIHRSTTKWANIKNLDKYGSVFIQIVGNKVAMYIVNPQKGAASFILCV